jgi:hypothetical protein
MKELLYKLAVKTMVVFMLLVFTFSPFQTQTALAQATTSTPPSCSFSPSTYDLCITNVIYVFTVSLGSIFAYTAAYFFDIAIQISLNGLSYALDFISTGWVTARDLANMTFLFILLYIAFMILLSADTSGTMSLLAGVIAVALLVNFSFFFTRVVIDAGNILSIQFYNSINAPPVSQSILGNTAANATNKAISFTGLSNENTKDLTAGIMGMLQVQNLFNTQSFQNFYGKQQGLSGFGVVFATLTFLYIAAAMILWAITVTFVAIGVKFLMRVVVLWFLIIASPLAMVAWTLPKFKQYFNEWLRLLISHAFYPVAFMFVFLILTNFTQQISCTDPSGNTIQNCTGLLQSIFVNVPENNNGTPPVGALAAGLANVALRLGFVLAILYIGMRASNYVSVMGASYADKAGGWAGGLFKNSIRYSAGWGTGALYRRTGGALAAGASSALANSRWANRTGTLGGAIGYRLRRNITEPLTNTSLGTVATTFREREKFLKTRKGEMTNNLRDRENKDRVTEVGKTVDENIKAGRKPLENVSDDDKKRIVSLSKRELEAMNAEQIKKISAILTEDQLKRVKEMDKFTDKEKEEIDTHWSEHSPNAPVQKASKALSEAAKHNSRLSSPDPDIANNTTVNTAVTKIMLENLKQKSQQKVDDASANKEMAKSALDEVSRKLVAGTANQTQVDAAKRIFAGAEAEHRNATNLHKELDTAEDLRGKVQPHHGGMTAAGEFKIKQV